MSLRPVSQIFSKHGSQYAAGSSGCSCGGNCSGGCSDTYEPERVSSVKEARFGLVILTHPAYERYFADVLTAVEKQRAHLDEIVLVINGEMLAPIPSDWKNLRVVRGSWPSPQHARNAGLQAAGAEWLCYLDGDNLPSAEYFARMRAAAMRADATSAVLYPGTVLRVTEQTEAQRVFVMPEWDELVAREKSIVDTSSAWRRTALASVGGWFPKSGMLDNYTTLLRLIHQGWRGARVADAVSVLRHHEGRRSKALETIAPSLWHARRHTLVTLFAGRDEPFAPLLDWYLQAELPPHTEIEWLDNSGSALFHDRLWQAGQLLKQRPEVRSLRITRENARCPGNAHGAVHGHVARLYNEALRGLSADVVVTVEDDVIPPLGALRPLLAPLQPWSSIAAVAAVYPARCNPRVATAALARDEWRRMPALADLPKDTLYPVGMVAGGCTAWSAPALRQMLPLHTTVHPLLGWDGNLCARLNKAGYRLLLATGTRCQHLCQAPNDRC